MGDVTDADVVVRAARGADSAIHCAALLGGASQDLADFEAVNIRGTKNVLDAAEAVDLGRVVAVSTGTFFDTAGGLDREEAPVSKEPSSNPTRSQEWWPSSMPCHAWRRAGTS